MARRHGAQSKRGRMVKLLMQGAAGVHRGRNGGAVERQEGPGTSCRILPAGSPGKSRKAGRCLPVELLGPRPAITRDFLKANSMPARGAAPTWSVFTGCTWICGVCSARPVRQSQLGGCKTTRWRKIRKRQRQHPQGLHRVVPQRRAVDYQGRCACASHNSLERRVVADRAVGSQRELQRRAHLRPSPEANRFPARR